MNKHEQILNWYRKISQVTFDDKADFEVMLMDKKNPTDALMAIGGLFINIVERGYQPPLMDLILLAAQEENAHTVRTRALYCALLAMVIHDEHFSKDAQAIDNLLNLLIHTHKMAFKMLCSIAHIQKTLKVLGFKKDIKSTLVYQLVVVGQQANQAFDQNCC